MPEILQSQNENAQSAARSSFYRIQGHSLSNTSLESESLLDHRLVRRVFILDIS